MTGSVVLPEELRRLMIGHCISALPNEGCGMLALDGDRVVRVYRTENEDASPVSYTIPPQEHFDALTDAESNGWLLGGVFHSHPAGPACMSGTDLERVADPRWLYVVVSLEGAEPVLAGWRDDEDVAL